MYIFCTIFLRCCTLEWNFGKFWSLLKNNPRGWWVLTVVCAFFNKRVASFEKLKVEHSKILHWICFSFACKPRDIRRKWNWMHFFSTLDSLSLSLSLLSFFSLNAKKLRQERCKNQETFLRSFYSFTFDLKAKPFPR